jgi:Tfp pilus assembly protein PilN
MIRINLLPREIYVEDAKRQIKTIAVSVLSAVALLMIGIYLIQFNAKRKADAENIELNTELRKYQAIVEQVEELSRTRDLLRARRDVIRQLLVGRLIYPKFFEDFMALLPSEVWLNSVDTTLDPQGVMAVNVTATSLSNFAIADWLTNLQSSPLCSSVVLGTITSQDQGEDKQPLLSFTLTFRYLRKES